MLKKLITLAMVVVSSYGYAQNTPSLDKDHAQLAIRNFETANTGGTLRHYYGKVILTEMLALPNAAKVHVFNGLDGEGHVHLIFKVANAEGMIINTSYAYDDGKVCPPSCSPGNIKNAGGTLEEGRAQQWVANFRDKYPNHASVFSFEGNEFKRVLSATGAEGMVMAYGIENGNESMILCAVDRDAAHLWDTYLTMSVGEKNSALYPEAKMVKKD
jgi:hypothetical protein